MSSCDRCLRPHESVAHCFSVKNVSGNSLRAGTVKTLKIVRNVVGTAGVVFIGHVFIASLKDVWRYIKISTM